MNNARNTPAPNQHLIDEANRLLKILKVNMKAAARTKQYWEEAGCPESGALYTQYIGNEMGLTRHRAEWEAAYNAALAAQKKG